MEEQNDVGGENLNVGGVNVGGVNVGGENVGSGQVPRVTSPGSALVKSLRPLRMRRTPDRQQCRSISPGLLEFHRDRRFQLRLGPVDEGPSHFQ